MLAFLWLSPAAATADEVKVVYMTTATADGRSVETRLTDAADDALPRLFPADGTMRVNSVVYARDAVSSIRFDVRTETADGIASAVADGGAAAGAVYSVSGRVVRSGSASVEGLPKGVYIVNRKKVVIR